MKGASRILPILLVLLCLSVVYAIWMSPRQQTISAQQAAVQPRVVVAAEGAGFPQLELERLDADPQPYPGARRDIFQFRQLRRAAPVQRGTAPKKVLPPPEVKQPGAAISTQQVTRELSRFTLLGFVETVVGKTVFLSSEGDVYVARAGQSFGRQQEFLVEQIDDDQLVVSRVGGAERIEVPLVENEPLAVSSRPAAVRRSPGPVTIETTGPTDAEENQNVSEQGIDHADAANGDGNGKQD